MVTSAGAVGVDILPEFRAFGARFRAGMAAQIRSNTPMDAYRTSGSRGGSAMADSASQSATRRGRAGMTAAGGALGGMLGLAFKSSVLGIVAGTLATIPLLVSKAAGSAGDLSETISLSNTLLGKSSKSWQDWSKNSVQNLGLSKKEALDYVNTFAYFNAQLGITGRENERQTKGILARATDIGSAFNVETAEVLEAYKSAMRGEFDPLQKFIPTIKAATVENEALRISHKKNAKDLTAAEKAQATYNLVMQGSAKVAGDWQKTNHGLAGQQKMLSANWQNLTAQIGQIFLPGAIRMTTWMNNTLMPSLRLLGRVFEAVFEGKWEKASKLLDRWWDGVWAWLSTAIPAFARRMWKLGESLVSWIGPRIGPATSKLVEYGGKLIGWILGTGLPWLARTTYRLGQELVAWIAPRWPGTKAKLLEWGGRLVNWLLTTAAPWVWQKIQELGKKLVDWIAPRWPGTRAKLLEWGGRLVNWITGTAAPWVWQKIQELGKKFVEWVAPRIRPMLIELARLGGRLVGWVVSQIPLVWAKLQVMGLQFISWIAPRIPGMLVKLALVQLAIGKWFLTKGIPAMIKFAGQMGLAFLDGLKDGVVAGMRNIGTWLKSTVVDPIISKVKSFFGIKSPSTVFAGIGRYLVQGLIGGLMSGSGSATAIISKVFGGMPEALGALVNKGSLSFLDLPRKALNALTGVSGLIKGFPGLGGLKGGGGGKYNLGPVHPAVAAAAGMLGRMFGISSIGGYRSRGSVPGSYHPRGLALDLMTRNVAKGNALAAYAWAHRGRLGINEVIWNRQIQTRSNPRKRPYRGPSPHTDHVHLSFGSLRKYDQGGWLMPGTTMAYNGTRDPELILTGDQQKALFSGRSSGHTFNIMARDIPVPRAIVEAQQRADLLDKMGVG